MSKLILLILLVLTVVFAGCFTFPKKLDSPYYKLATVSPDGKYRINLEERFSDGRISDPFHRSLILNATNGDKIFFKDENMLTRGKYSDTPFADRFPHHKWLKNNIIWMGDSVLEEEYLKDRVSLRNDAVKMAKSLTLLANSQCFIAFDIPPSQTVILEALHERGAPNRWVSVHAMFEDGTSTGTSLSFDIQDSGSRSAHFCADLQESEMNLVSQEYDGFGSSNKHVKKNIQCSP